MANQEKFFVEFGVDTDSTSSFKVPAGTTAQRDASPESGLFRYNTSTNQFEGYSNGSWGEIGGSSLGQSFDVDTFTGDNSTTAFTLSRSVSSEDYLIVFIDGVFQGQSSYVLSGTTLTLDSAPATGSSIIAYSVVPISVAEIPADTDDLTEGSTNLYFTNARVDSRLSSGSVSTIETSGNVTVGGDLSVSGGLTVSGTTTTVNSTTTSVTDSMIELANSNTSSDVIDIGIYGNYDDGLSDGGATEYTGLFRDASDSTWKLFDGLEEEPGTTVNTAGTNYAKAALEVGDLDATTLTVLGDVSVGTSTDSSRYVILDKSTTGENGILFKNAGNNKGKILLDSSEDMQFYVNSTTNAMTIKESGNIGIGQSSPDTILHIGDGSSNYVRIENAGSGDVSSGYQIYRGASLGMNLYDNPADNTTSLQVAGALNINAGGSGTDLHVSSSGNVGINWGNPTARLGIIQSGSSTPGMNITDGSSSDFHVLAGYSSGLCIIGPSAGSLGIKTANSERMRIDTSGQVMVGSSSSISSFYNGAGSEVGFGGNPSGWMAAVRGSTNTPLYVSHSGTGSGEFIRFSQSTTGRGYIHWNGTTLQLTSTSDHRLKENVEPIADATTRINALNPVAYNLIEGGDSAEGFLAHELQEHVPHAVTGTYNEVYTAEDLQDEDSEDLIGTPKYQTVSYASLTPLLVKALQESNAKIAELEARIETLENA